MGLVEWLVVCGYIGEYYAGKFIIHWVKNLKIFPKIGGNPLRSLSNIPLDYFENQKLEFNNPEFNISGHFNNRKFQELII